MSWGTCYSGSNNIHMGFPALMSDGRLYANWDAAWGMNNALKAKEGIKNNYDYRQYLIKNGSQVMRQNAIAACDNCCACKENYNKTPRVNEKYIFKSCSDTFKFSLSAFSSALLLNACFNAFKRVSAETFST